MTVIGRTYTYFTLMEMTNIPSYNVFTLNDKTFIFKVHSRLKRKASK